MKSCEMQSYVKVLIDQEVQITKMVFCLSSDQQQWLAYVKKMDANLEYVNIPDLSGTWSLKVKFTVKHLKVI